MLSKRSYTKASRSMVALYEIYRQIYKSMETESTLVFTYGLCISLKKLGCGNKPTDAGGGGWGVRK